MRVTAKCDDVATAHALLIDDVSNRCAVGADKIVDLHKCAVTVSTSAECGTVADPLLEVSRALYFM